MSDELIYPHYWSPQGRESPARPRLCGLPSWPISGPSTGSHPTSLSSCILQLTRPGAFFWYSSIQCWSMYVGSWGCFPFHQWDAANPDNIVFCILPMLITVFVFVSELGNPIVDIWEILETLCAIRICPSIHVLGGLDGANSKKWRIGFSVGRQTPLCRLVGDLRVFFSLSDGDHLWSLLKVHK